MQNGTVIYLPTLNCRVGLPEEPTFRELSLERRRDRRAKRFLTIAEGVVTTLIGVGFTVCFFLLFWMM